MNHIVVDLEMNTIGKKHPARAIWRQEIIEIGAVLMDDNLTVIAAFRTYVKPEYRSIPMWRRLPELPIRWWEMHLLFQRPFICLQTGAWEPEKNLRSMHGAILTMPR